MKHLFNTKYKQTKIYLSGAITGRENYKQEFYKAKEKLIKFQKDNNKRKDTEKIDLDIIVPFLVNENGTVIAGAGGNL
ncbi:hypothetical protein SZ44_13075, partial [Brachyspira hyodysenteriae]